MDRRIQIDDNVAFLPGANVAVMMESSPAGAKQSSPIVKDSYGGSSDEIVPWGDGNQYPQDVIEITSKSTEFMPLLEKKVAIFYGDGIYPAQITGYDNDGYEIYKPVFDKEIIQWQKRNNIDRWLQEALLDLNLFFNGFEELIISKDRKTINQIVHQETAYCRYAKMNTNGIIPSVFINANWPNAKSSDEETAKVDLIDPYNANRVEDLRENSKFKFIYPIHIPSPGKSYYQLAYWDGWRTSGWADVAAAIPKWKTALMKNQITIKYLIRVPYVFWEQKYNDWNQKPELQSERKKEILDKVNEWLTDLDNTGKSIMTEYGLDSRLNKELQGWEIKAIEGNKFESGAYIEDSQEASAHLMRSLGIDPAIPGTGPGKKMGAGSGSDKRVAFNISELTAPFYRRSIIEVLGFISDYNGWSTRYDDMLVWRFRGGKINTLDKGIEINKEV